IVRWGIFSSLAADSASVGLRLHAFILFSESVLIIVISLIMFPESESCLDRTMEAQVTLVRARMIEATRFKDGESTVSPQTRCGAFCQLLKFWDILPYVSKS